MGEVSKENVAAPEVYWANSKVKEERCEKIEGGWGLNATPETVGGHQKGSDPGWGWGRKRDSLPCPEQENEHIDGVGVTEAERRPNTLPCLGRS